MECLLVNFVLRSLPSDNDGRFLALLQTSERFLTAIVKLRNEYGFSYDLPTQLALLGSRALFLCPGFSVEAVASATVLLPGECA